MEAPPSGEPFKGPPGESKAGFFQRKMMSQIFIVGVGFMCDAYDLFVINNVLFVMRQVYPQTPEEKGLVASTALVGAVIGQLFFGGLADVIGRKVIFVVTLLLIVIGAVGSALSFQSPLFSVYQHLAFCRFILGLGVGGEYPLAASIAAESSSPAVRGRAIAAVFSMQGIGQLLAAAVVNICLATGASYEFTWRFSLAFGAIPALAIFYFRAKMDETQDFQTVQATRVSHWENLKAAFRVWWKAILGCAGAWFLLDISFYGNGLFTSTITQLMGLGDTPQDAALATLYTVMLAIPGYYFTVALLDVVGRWRLQLAGFSMLVILFLVLGAGFHTLKNLPTLFILLYGLTFFFSNFGPNSTTYIIPGEYFPAQVKSTCHGLSAASGKIGAAVAGLAFPPAMVHFGLPAVLYLCALVAFLGVLVTFLVPDYSADQLEDIKKAHLKEFEVMLNKQEGEGMVAPSKRETETPKAKCSDSMEDPLLP